jgi:hypothetical protein
LIITGLNAQTASLVLASATAASGGTASLDLSLHVSSGRRPAAIQWMFQYPSSSISSFTVDDGPASSAAGKAVLCTGDAKAYTCVAVGSNAKTIADGVVARVTAVLAPGVATATIRVTNALGVAATSDPIPISATGATITRAKASPDSKPQPPPGAAGGR